MSELILLTLATLGSWDILRRLLPGRVPTAAGKICCVLIALSLLKWGSHSMLLALSVPGSLILVGKLLAPEPHTPWGPYVADLGRFIQLRHKATSDPREAIPPPSRIGHRIPKL